MEKILVTTDFSANSKAGIRFAIQLSKQTGAELIFYHAVEVLKPTAWSKTRYNEFADKTIAENTEKLKKFLKDLIPVGFKNRFAYIIEIGVQVVEMVEKTAKKQKADLICLSTRGGGKVQKIFGTYASTLITTSHTPVVSVPSGYRVKPIDSIYYASDFAAITKELKQVEEFANSLTARVEVYHYDYMLHVLENVKKLERKITKLRKPNISFHLKRQEIEIPLSEHFRHDIEKTKPSLVVLFTKQNRNWFDRMFLSSESADMAFHLSVPLLTFRKK